MNLSFQDQPVWVVGGAGYLGSAIVTALDGSGARTICIDLPGRAKALIEGQGLTRTTAAEFDIGDTEAVPNYVSGLIELFGAPSGVVILAMGTSSGKSFDEITGEDFDRTLRLSVTANHIFARAAADRMQGGSLVFFSSMYGLGSPHPEDYQPGDQGRMTVNPVDYGASKAAIVQLTRYFAMQYGRHGIRANCVAPGPFPNPGVQAAHPEFVANLSGRTMLGRIGQSPEISGVVLFLLSPASAFVTGQCLAVDGGWTAW